MINLSKRTGNAVKNFRGNELIVLPSDGEFGFRTYFDLKTEALMKRKKLYSFREDNQLLLAYPPREAGAVTFQRFFESADLKSRGSGFAGCFAIDITEYLERTDSEEFISLMAYTAHEKDIHFMLLLFTEEEESVKKVHEVLMRYGLYDLVKFSWPAPEDLAEYIVGRFYEYHSEPENEAITEHIAALLSGKKREYEYADSVVNELINRDCSTDPEELEKTLTEIILKEQPEARTVSLGFRAGR